ncbi:MAG: tRNA (guanosine(46)-N7)-methyltransferase TrmB [Cyclobacteriaceae bacterium]
MSRRKTRKFADNDRRDNVIQRGKPLFDTIKGRWRAHYFGNEGDVVLELACGRGEYTVGLAPVYPEKNFIGIDIKGDRIWKGSSKAEEQQLKNVAFLRTQIQLLEDFFSPGEVDEIWIVFPDPRPKGRDEHRRLTHPRFLQIYNKILKPGGIVRLKTDNTSLFEYSMEVIPEFPGVCEFRFTQDLYNSQYNDLHCNITTKYELMFRDQGEIIKYLQFRLG